MLIAEGSDWFWWYGDDHSSDHDLEFDELFRRHVRNVYRALDKPVPEELFVTNISTAPPAVRIEPPTGFIHPVIDGEVTSYFEWVGAGCVDAADTAGRDAPGGGQDADCHGRRVRRRPATPVPPRRRHRSRCDATCDAGRRAARQVPQAGRSQVAAAGGPGQASWRGWRTGRAAATGSRVSVPAWQRRSARSLELRIPFACLGVRPHDTVAFLVAVTREGAEVEHHPRHGPIEVEVPDREFPARNWTA